MSVAARPLDRAAALRSALTRATAALRQRSDTPRLDAELLLARALNTTREEVVLATAGLGGEQPPAPQGWQRRFAALLARRAAGEPVAYLTGRRAFRRLELAVDRRAFIPRPESELLVEVGRSLPSGARVVDVGTGSGAIALALKEERPDLEVVGCDRSGAALSLASENGRRLGLAVRFVEADLLEGVGEPFAVLCNPPYIPAGAAVPPELGFEPREALYGGPDGLAVIRRLCRALAAAPTVVLAAIEFGEGQGQAVVELLRAARFGAVEVVRDLAGRPRVAVGRRDG